MPGPTPRKAPARKTAAAKPALAVPVGAHHVFRFADGTETRINLRQPRVIMTFEERYGEIDEDDMSMRQLMRLAHSVLGGDKDFDEFVDSVVDMEFVEPGKDDARS